MGKGLVKPSLNFSKLVETISKPIEPPSKSQGFMCLSYFCYVKSSLHSLQKSAGCQFTGFPTFSGSPLQTTLMQIRLKELLKLIKRNLASGVVIQIRVVRTWHDVQLFVFAAQRFERVFAEIA